MSLLERFAYRVQNLWASVNQTPILVLGNQKSGTSAIAHLLADYGGLSKTVDIPPLWIPRSIEIMRGSRSFAEVVERHPAYFARDVIKEPMMTFFADEVINRFPEATYVFIVRDPRSNIRSLLNSRRIPGDLEALSETLQPDSPAHRYVADPNLWGGHGENYVGVLANRWNRAVAQYFDHEDRMHLVKYEDFMDDKYRCIAVLANAVGVPQREEIADRLDRAYQPRGNRTISWREFFGQTNLARIERICETGMRRLSYVSAESPPT